MKQIFLFSFFSLLCINSSFAALDFVPLVREGVKWVNEKVVINQGDTTYSYYTYEMTDGTIPERYYIVDADPQMVCHYYTGPQLDAENDSIISYIAQVYWQVNYSLNHVQAKAASENRNLLHLMTQPGIYDGIVLYCFNPLQVINIWEYMLHQIDPVFNEDNLIEVEPIEVDGVSCQRIAHVNDQGDVLFYIVESIGFDSRDMGDLLSPFMRPPDPDADYQEYWGLSHVIKDGKIIYKGMRYDEDHLSSVNELKADRNRSTDGNYYNLMGQPVGQDVPTTPGIYIHQGKKIVIR